MFIEIVIEFCFVGPSSLRSAALLYVWYQYISHGLMDEFLLENAKKNCIIVVYSVISNHIYLDRRIL